MTTENEMTITDVKIPFGSLVVLFVKMALAAIPAAIIIGFVALSFGTGFALLV